MRRAKRASTAGQPRGQIIGGLSIRAPQLGVTMLVQVPGKDTGPARAHTPRYIAPIYVGLDVSRDKTVA